MPTVFSPVIQNGHVHSPDDSVMGFLRGEKANIDVLPLINNFDPVAKQWLTNVGDFLNDPDARQTFRKQLLVFLASDKFKGAPSILKKFLLSAQPGFSALIAELGQDLHGRGLKLYVNVPVSDKDFDYPNLAANSDGLVIMNYDQHQTTSGPGTDCGAAMVCFQPQAGAERYSQNQDHLRHWQLWI